MVERETEGGEGQPRAKNKIPRYFQNIDQNSTSFFVTNFPEDCSVEDLWKIFAKFGVVGDVYIPKKADKWGRRFAFVKFRKVKDVNELTLTLEDVWCGSFKLKINRFRFERNEESTKQEKPVSGRVWVDGEPSVTQGRSFRDALGKNHQETGLQQLALQRAEEEVLQIEVDALVLQELEKSFVCVLALDVDVSKIKTTLYMEGLAHFSVTDMGRNMVLLFSPREGELQAMTRAKPDWLSYYFKEFKAWSPNCFADRRVIWVKVLGIPLHVWGENLFKVIGGKYGEFLDFDESTASRQKLDVARIKTATSFRASIDD
jgi:hypothetical protein